MDFWKKSNKNTSKVSRVPAWLVGVVVGVCFLTIGIFNDQLVDIYRKAIMICLECIGIG